MWLWPEAAGHKELYFFSSKAISLASSKAEPPPAPGRPETKQRMNMLSPSPTILALEREKWEILSLEFRTDSPSGRTERRAKWKQQTWSPPGRSGPGGSGSQL